MNDFYLNQKWLGELQKEAGAAGAAREGVVAGRQEGVEVPGVGVEVGEVLEVTVDEEDSEVIAVEEASEAMVAVVAVVVVAAEDSEEVAVVSEAHNTSDAQFFFFPTGFVQRHSCASNRRLQKGI